MRHALLLIVIAASIACARAQNDYETINFAINWAGGIPSPACNSCVPASFACSDGDGAWNGGVLDFMDPYPGPVSGKTILPIAVNLTITGFFNCNSSSFRQMYLFMQVRLTCLFLRHSVTVVDVFDRPRHECHHLARGAGGLRLPWLCIIGFSYAVTDLVGRHRPLHVRYICASLC